MTCDYCPQMAVIHRALAKCQRCDCASSHHGASHVLASDFTLSKRIAPEPVKLTKLPEDVEDSLRTTLASIFALKPEDLLMVQHVMTGGSVASFGVKAGEIAKDILSRRKALHRSSLTRRRDAIVDRIPELKPVFDAVFHVKSANNGQIRTGAW